MTGARSNVPKHSHYHARADSLARLEEVPPTIVDFSGGSTRLLPVEPMLALVRRVPEENPSVVVQYV